MNDIEELKEKRPQKRPLSPHLTIYKPQITSVLSIGHRMSGVGLFVMLLAMCWWFVFWVFSGFDICYMQCFDNMLLKILLFITSYGYFYHLSTGVRHLIWDTGCGLSLQSINRSGLLVICLSVLLTVGFWVIIN